MADYKELYFKLFNEVTDIIERLKEVQCEMEDRCIEEDEATAKQEGIPPKTPYTKKDSPCATLVLLVSGCRFFIIQPRQRFCIRQAHQLPESHRHHL